MNQINMSQKGISVIVIILIIVGILAVAGGVYYFTLQKPSQPKQPVLPASSEEEPVTPTPPEEQPSFADETADWKTYQGKKFQILIPPQWHEDFRRPGLLISADNSAYYLVFDVINLDQYPDTTVKSLYLSGKLLEAEQTIVKGMCGETEGCGEIVESKTISIDGGVGIEFIVQYKGMRIDEPRGFSNEIHRTILKNGVVYRFWTSEQVAPDELKNEYPKLEPSPIELFRNILDTFKGL